MDVFGVSEHIVHKAHKLCLEICILAVPEPKRGKSLPADIAQLVEVFYQDDEKTTLELNVIFIRRNDSSCAT